MYGLFYVFQMAYLEKARFRKPSRNTVMYIVRIFQPISSNRSYGKILIDFVGINCRIQGGSVNSNIITLRKRKREKKNLKCKRRPENC